jgi:mRNA interferase YafQ
MYFVVHSKAYNKAIKKFVKSGKVKLSEVDVVVDLIANKKILPIKYRDHKLNGEFSEYRECHIRGDVLLVYKVIKDELVLVLIDIGTHSYLF